MHFAPSPTASASQQAGVEQLLRSQMRCRNFRGIRTNPADAEDAAFCRGMQFLADHNLSFEWSGFSPTFYYKRGLRKLQAIATKFPTVTIVMNHCGAVVGPTLMPTDGDDFALWRADIADLAASCANVNPTNSTHYSAPR